MNAREVTRHESLRVTALVFATIVLVAATTSLQSSLPSKKEAADILQKAFEGMNLRESGAPPFHLLAHVHFELPSRSQDGMYELLWAAPDRYREIFKMGSIVESDVALGDKLHVFRNAPILPLPLWELRSVLESPVPSDFKTEFQVAKVSSDQVGGDIRTCLSATKYDQPDNVSLVEERACFDPVTHEASSLAIEAKSGFAKARLELDNFVSIGTKRYPCNIKRNLSGQSVEVKIDTLDQVTKFADSIFIPIPGAEPREWCPVPTATVTFPDPSEPTFSQEKADALTVYYLVIGRDGRVKKYTPLSALDPKVEKKITSWLQRARFSIHRCANEPIEYETYYFPVIEMPH